MCTGRCKQKKVRRTFFPPNRPTSHLWRGDLEPWVQGTPRNHTLSNPKAAALEFPAEDGAHEVRWTSALRRPERSGDLEPWVQGTLRYGKRKASGSHLRLQTVDKDGSWIYIPEPSFFYQTNCVQNRNFAVFSSLQQSPFCLYLC